MQPYATASCNVREAEDRFYLRMLPPDTEPGHRARDFVEVQSHQNTLLAGHATETVNLQCKRFLRAHEQHASQERLNGNSGSGRRLGSGISLSGSFTCFRLAAG